MVNIVKYIYQNGVKMRNRVVIISLILNMTLFTGLEMGVVDMRISMTSRQ